MRPAGLAERVDVLDVYSQLPLRAQPHQLDEPLRRAGVPENADLSGARLGHLDVDASRASEAS
jgi:hypothetical protein